jgi:hypothetical protein
LDFVSFEERDEIFNGSRRVADSKDRRGHGRFQKFRVGKIWRKSTSSVYILRPDSPRDFRPTCPPVTNSRRQQQPLAT